MTTLTATPDLVTGTVRLLATGLPDSPVTITRTDAAGRTGVRMRAGQVPALGVLDVTDYEPALAGLVTYEVLGATASVDLTEAASTWLTVPLVVERSQQVALGVVVASQRDSQTTVHQVIGRPDPVAVLRPLTTRRGTLTVWCPDYVAAQSIADLYALGEVVQLRQPDYPGLDMYHVAETLGTVVEAPMTNPRRWTVTLGFVEVARPAGPRRGTAGWTYATVAATYASYVDVLAAWPTYDDLTLGPAS